MTHRAPRYYPCRYWGRHVHRQAAAAPVTPTVLAARRSDSEGLLLPDLAGGVVEPLPEEDVFHQHCEQLSTGARGKE
jgi:hypothetical protein